MIENTPKFGILGALAKYYLTKKRPTDPNILKFHVRATQQIFFALWVHALMATWVCVGDVHVSVKCILHISSGFDLPGVALLNATPFFFSDLLCNLESV